MTFFMVPIVAWWRLKITNKTPAARSNTVIEPIDMAKMDPRGNFGVCSVVVSFGVVWMAASARVAMVVATTSGGIIIGGTTILPLLLDCVALVELAVRPTIPVVLVVSGVAVDSVVVRAGIVGLNVGLAVVCFAGSSFGHAPIQPERNARERGRAHKVVRIVVLKEDFNFR